MAFFAKRAGDLDMVGIPNKNGAAGVIHDMLRGDVQAAFLNVASTAGQVQAGNFRPCAVVNHARLKEYPDIPTMKEVGFPDVGTVAWNGLFAPAATPNAGAGSSVQGREQGAQSPEAEKLTSRTSTSCRTSRWPMPRAGSTAR